MRRELIETGKTYWDRKKGLRKILQIGPDDWGNECVRYALLCGKSNSQPRHHDEVGNPVFGCYTHSFQVWAKEVVEFGPEALK